MRAQAIKTRQRGFTLIEMAIAMSILGLMLGGGMLAMTAILDKAALDKTMQNLDKIETALLVYVLSNNRLPCPDTDDDGSYDGAEDTCSGTAARGIVPYRTIGVLKNEASDGFDRFISYVVDVAHTNTTTNPLMCGTSRFSEVDSILAVTDAAGNASTLDAAPAYALVYHGKNGLGAIMSSGVAFGRVPVDDVGNQPAEYDNSLLTSAPEILRAEPLTAEPNVGFDDVIRAKPAARILYDAGCTSG